MTIKPFESMEYDDFKRKITEMEKKCGHNLCGYVTIDKMRTHLTGVEWAGLKDRKSFLTKFLTSEVFKGSTHRQIDSTSLKLYALKHCKGTKEEKKKAKRDIILEDMRLNVDDKI